MLIVQEVGLLSLTVYSKKTKFFDFSNKPDPFNYVLRHISFSGLYFFFVDFDIWSKRNIKGQLFLRTNGEVKKIRLHVVLKRSTAYNDLLVYWRFCSLVLCEAAGCRTAGVSATIGSDGAVCTGTKTLPNNCCLVCETCVKKKKNPNNQKRI